MATHIPGGTTQYFCLLVFLVPVSGLSELAEGLTTLGVAKESVFLGLLSSLCLSLFLGLGLCSETIALLLALLGNMASALPWHTPPSHWQSAATAPRPAP